MEYLRSPALFNSEEIASPSFFFTVPGRKLRILWGCQPVASLICLMDAPLLFRSNLGSKARLEDFWADLVDINYLRGGDIGNSRSPTEIGPECFPSRPRATSLVPLRGRMDAPFPTEVH